MQGTARPTNRAGVMPEVLSGRMQRVEPGRGRDGTGGVYGIQRRRAHLNRVRNRAPVGKPDLKGEGSPHPNDRPRILAAETERVLAVDTS